MTKAGFAMLFLAWPGVLLAQPQLEILAPAGDVCVNNGDVVFEGGIIGGQVQPPALNVGTVLRIGDGQGRPVALEMTLATPNAIPPAPLQLPCAEDAQCAAGNDGVCFAGGLCGCFIDQDCGGGAACVDGICGCAADAECGANGRCMDDGRCGCANDNACAAGQACGMNGVCGCANDGQCGDDQVCVDAECMILENTEVFNAMYTPNGAAPEQTDLYSFNGDAVLDAPRKLMIIRATAGGQTVEDRVLFQLDREMPTIEFDQAFMAGLGDCRDVPPDLNGDLPGQIVDAQDPNPQIARIDQEVDGCNVTQRIEVVDACGNAQALRLTTTTEPPPNAVSVSLSGYRCGLEGCVIDDAFAFEDGDRLGRGALAYTIDGPAGCFDQVAADYTINGGNPNVLIPGQTLESVSALLRAPLGPYALADGNTLQLQISDGDVQTVTFRAADFEDIAQATTQETIRAINTQVEDVIADVDLGLIFRTLSRGSSTSIEITGGTALPAFALAPGVRVEGRGDGVYAASINVFACGEEQPIAQANLGFTILDRPVADAGGPYTANQGEVVQLTAEESFAAEELGGIAEYAWDIDGDGTFDLIGDENTALTADFDSSETGDGEFRVLLRITAGNGTVEFDSAVVIIEDVSPSCDLGNGGMPYAGNEGELVDFDGSASAPGHATDPIIAFDWNFGDNAFPQRGAELQETAHVFQEAGAFTVVLRVEDTDSFTECERVVNIEDIAPEIRSAGAFDAENLIEGQPVRFFVEAAPGSPADAIQLISWNFGDGAQPLNGLDRNPEHTYMDDTGDRPAYNVCVQVADEDDQLEECFELTIHDLQPEPAINGQQVGNEGETFFFDLTNTVAGGRADPLERIEVDFGDGSPVHVINNVDDPQARLVQHRVVRSGDIQVEACAFDEDSSACATLAVQVRDVTPRARAVAIYDNPEQTGYEGQALRLDASGSEGGSDTDPIVSYSWDFGDGSDIFDSDEPTTEHVFPNQGTYAVLMTVVDSDGSLNSVHLTVSVANVAPQGARIVSPPQFEIGEPAVFRVEYSDVPADIPPTSLQWFVDDELVSEDLELNTSFGHLGEATVSVRIVDNGGGAAEAEATIQITAAAPQIAQLVQQVGREGQPMTFDVEVTPALLDAEGNLDAPVRIVTPVVPEGAEVELIEEVAPINEVDTVVRTIVRVTWTPTYYDAGEHILRIRAEGRFNEVNRTRDIPIRIDEAGAPILATSGGTGRRGQVTLYDYGRESGIVTFRARARIDIGIGASGLAHDASGRFVYAATPGTGGVAVVSTQESRLVRVVPTGNGTNGVAFGSDYIWAINSTTSELVAIDAATLKVDTRMSLLPMEKPRDIHWLPSGFAGLATPHIAVIGARTGDLSIIDPEAVLAGDAAVVAHVTLGGALTRVVADVQTGHLIIADGKTHTVYDVDLASLLADPERFDVNGEELDFAPYDLFASDGMWWAATDAGLVRFAEGEVTISENIQARAVAPLPSAIVSDGILVIATEERVENLNEDMDRLIDAAGGRIRRLAAFVAFE